MKWNLIKFLILFTFMVSGCSLDLKTKDIAKTQLMEHSQAIHAMKTIQQQIFNTTIYVL